MRGRYLFALVGLLLVASCDDDAHVDDDTGVPDTFVSTDADSGPVGDKGITDGPADDGPLKPDGPKMPAEWKTIQDPAPKIEDHTVTLLKNGDVLIAGGNRYDGTNDDYQDLSYRFVPSTEKFEDAGKMTVVKAEHTATLLNDGRVLVTGGKNDANYLQSAEVFHPTQPAAQAWSAVPDMFSHRWSHTATRMNNGEVLIAGGF